MNFKARFEIVVQEGLIYQCVPYAKSYTIYKKVVPILNKNKIFLKRIKKVFGFRKNVKKGEKIKISKILE